MSYLNTTKGKIKFKQHLLYPGCHVINKDTAFENLKIIHKVLSNKNIFWEVSWGTLIGIVRDNDFIDWDEDVDIVILEEEEEDFKTALWELQDCGFELIRYERGGLYSISKNGEYTDFYVLRKASSEIRYTLDGGFFLEKHLVESSIIDFKGLSLRIPKDYDDFLTFYYGDWQTPVQYYFTDLSLLKRIKMIGNYFCRIYLPDCVYYRIIRKRRSSDINAFIDKVKTKGIVLEEEPQILI